MGVLSDYAPKWLEAHDIKRFLVRNFALWPVDITSCVDVEGVSLETLKMEKYSYREPCTDPNFGLRVPQTEWLLKGVNCMHFNDSIRGCMFCCVQHNFRVPDWEVSDTKSNLYWTVAWSRNVPFTYRVALPSIEWFRLDGP